MEKEILAVFKFHKLLLSDIQSATVADAEIDIGDDGLTTMVVTVIIDVKEEALEDNEI